LDRHGAPVQFTASQIARACAGRVARGRPDATCMGVSTDTRTLEPGRAFFALRGPTHDGHRYLREAARAGAEILVIESWAPEGPPEGPAAVVLVADTRRALLALAADHRRQLGGCVVAVTGSCGKSTVKEMLGAMVSSAAACTVAPASFNNQVGVALSLLAADPADEFIILELGTSHPGEIDELAAAARPYMGIVTTIAEAHLEGLGSLDGVREAKAELIPHIDPDGVLVLNADLPACASLARRFPGRVRTFGLSATAHVRISAVRLCSGNWHFNAWGRGFSLGLAGRHNVTNAAAALCAAAELGVPPEHARRALQQFAGAPLRFERRVVGGVTFILDCYNSNPAAMRTAAESLLCETARGRRVVVCGDMLELGPETARFHYETGAYLATLGVDALIAVGSSARHVVSGWFNCAAMGRPTSLYASAQQAWRGIWRQLQPGDVVLVKGSRRMGLETVVEQIVAHTAGRREAA
jgi:UDP-N-acetylmuramoyl-tripeptide--D-alanyl-D-alanine ligase